MDPEQARERVGLGVTELGELACDVLHGAVSLTQLHTGQGRALRDRPGGGSETVGGQRRRKGLSARGDVLAGGGELDRVALLQLGSALAGELAHRVGSGVLGKEPQGRRGNIVIVAVHAGVPSRGEDVCAGGPATTATASTSDGWLALLDGALLGERVQVSTDSSGRQAQA